MLRADLLLRLRSRGLRLMDRTGDRGSPMGADRPKDGIDGMLDNRRRGPTGTVGVGAASSM